MKIRIIIIFTLFAAGIAAITAFELKTGNNNDPEYSKTELYFRLSIPGGSNMSAAGWQAFTDTVIAVSSYRWLYFD
jgi:hypothetical protein